MWLEYFGLVDNDIVFYVFCAVSGVIVILSLVNMFIGCCLRVESRASPGTSIDIYIVLGAIVLTFTVLARGVNSSWGDYDTYKIICQMYPTTLIVGLTMFIGGQMVKAWGIFAFFKWQKKQPLKEEWKPNLWMWLLILIAAALSVVWVIIYRPELQSRLDLAIGLNDSNHPVYECTSENEFEWQLSTSVWHAFLLLLAVIACFIDCCIACRHAKGPISVLSIIVLNTLGCVVAGICLHFLYDGSQTIMYAITGALVLWPCLLADILLLVAKVSGGRSKDYEDHYDKPDSGL